MYLLKIFYSNFAVCRGSFIKVFRISPDLKFIIFILPSGVRKKITFAEVTYFLTKEPALKTQKPKTKKASNYLICNKRVHVRGVAKNAVDHPNGGSGRSGLLRKKSP